jgi:hypothetical protein
MAKLPVVQATAEANHFVKLNVLRMPIRLRKPYVECVASLWERLPENGVIDLSTLLLPFIISLEQHLPHRCLSFAKFLLTCLAESVDIPASIRIPMKLDTEADYTNVLLKNILAARLDYLIQILIDLLETCVGRNVRAQNNMSAASLDAVMFVSTIKQLDKDLLLLLDISLVHKSVLESVSGAEANATWVATWCTVFHAVCVHSGDKAKIEEKIASLTESLNPMAPKSNAADDELQTPTEIPSEDSPVIKKELSDDVAVSTFAPGARGCVKLKAQVWHVVFPKTILRFLTMCE